ncbi:MAG: hypothetical protein ACLFSM_06080 [Thermoplasmata archaeon]
MDISGDIVRVVVTILGRKPAFDACKYWVKRIKEKVP